MSRWAATRKARLAKPSQLDAVEDLTVRVGQRICAIVYSQPCGCAQRGLNQVCDTMKLAAQHAFSEIRGE